jgi:hypothetical protein
MPPTTISQKTGTTATPVAQKVISGWTQVAQKTGTPATPIMQKPPGVTGYTEVTAK